MKQFHPVDVPGVANIPADPIEERGDFAQPILRRDAVVAKDIDRALANDEVARSLFHQSTDQSCGVQRSSRARRDPKSMNARKLRSTWPHHSQSTVQAVARTTTG